MSFRPGNTHIGNCLDVWDRLREATEKDGCGTKHFLRKKLAFLPNAPSENSLPSCSLLPRLQIDMARSQNWFRNWFKMANGKTEYQRISISVSWSWCVFSFDWKPCHLYYALIQLDPKTKGGLKVKVTKLEPHLSHICFLSKRCQMLHVPYGGPCSPPPLSWYWHLPAGAFERGILAFQSANAQNATFSKVSHWGDEFISQPLLLSIPSPGLSGRAQCHVPRVQPTAQSSR